MSATNKSQNKKKISIPPKLWMSIVLVVLFGCGMLFFVWVQNENTITKELRFFMQQTCDNLQSRLDYLNKIVYDLRDNQIIMSELENEDGFTENGSAGEAFRSAVNIGEINNNAGGSRPIVEAVWLFDAKADFVRSFYYALSETEMDQKDAAAVQVLNSFMRSNSVDFYYEVKENGSIYLVKLLYNDDMKTAGILVFEMKRQMLELLMENTEDYQKSVWMIYDEQTNKIASSGMAIPHEQIEALRTAFQYDAYEGKIESEIYFIYTAQLPMNLMATIAVPKRQIIVMLYDAVKLYLILIVAAIVLLAIFVRYLLTQVYEKQYTLREMELKYVREQMNPHFMYNVLSSIAIQAKLDGDVQVSQMLHSFIQLTKARIDRGDSDKVKIRQELEYIRYYLYLQNCRFGDRICYDIQVEDESLLECLVPKLCLQLIVENAVVHGLEPKIGKGKVTVRIYCHGEQEIWLDTIDDGVGFPQDGDIVLPLSFEKKDEEHNHVGLNNVYQFIRLIYGENYGLTIVSTKGCGTTVHMRIPYEVEERMA